MEHRTALVTGASSGIGRCLALGLASRGVEVALAARRLDVLETVASEVRAAGGRCRVVGLDVTDGESTVAAVRGVDEEIGGLDLVVACAGVARVRWAGKLAPEDWQQTVDVNVTGAVATLTALVDRMVERKRGHLVGVSSLAGERALPKMAVYCASKAFLSRFLEGLRLDLRGSGIVVTDVRPGFVRTPMNEGAGPMPFEMDATAAGEAILRGVLARKSVVAFPWQTAAMMRAVVAAPRPLYDRVMGRRR